MNLNVHKDIIFSSPIRVRRMGEVRVGVNNESRHKEDFWFRGTESYNVGCARGYA